MRKIIKSRVRWIGLLMPVVFILLFAAFIIRPAFWNPDVFISVDKAILKPNPRHNVESLTVFYSITNLSRLNSVYVKKARDIDYVPVALQVFPNRKKLNHSGGYGRLSFPFELIKNQSIKGGSRTVAFTEEFTGNEEVVITTQIYRKHQLQKTG